MGRRGSRLDGSEMTKVALGVATVEDIKQALAIEAVVAEYVPGLKRTGATYKACCPFHSEKTPSFTVSPERQTFKCFGCGAGGDVVTFVEKIENLDFKDAVRKLAEKAGLPVSFEPTPTEDPEAESIFALNLAATLYFQGMLRSSQGRHALDYVWSRGLTESTIERFALGYAPAGWDNLKGYLTSRGHTPEALLAAGLTTARDDGGQYDRFRERLMFPIRDTKGRIAGFGARALDDAQPKYLNTKQTKVFDKGSIFYCQDVAGEHTRKLGRVVVVEGYMDALAAQQAGFGDVVASMGTSLTDKQMRMLQKTGRKVVLALDGDAAGERAMERTIQLAYQIVDAQLTPMHTTRVPTEHAIARYTRRADMRLHVAALPEGKDPDDLIKADPNAWRDLIDHAMPIVDFYFQLVTNSLRDSLDFKQEAVDRMLPVLAEIADPLERDHYIGRLSRLVQVGEPVLASAVAQYRARPAQAPRRPPPTMEQADVPAPPPAPRRSPKNKWSAERTVQRNVLSLLLRYPQWIGRVSNELVQRSYHDALLESLAKQLIELAGQSPSDTTQLLALLAPEVKTFAAEVLLDTASQGEHDDEPLRREFAKLFKRWDEEGIRSRLGKVESALREATTQDEPALRGEADALTREIREVFAQRRAI
jgi:DNA primase